MKKSNKLTIFYILSSTFLLVLLLGGGIYGVYLSVGLSFVRSGVTNVADSVNASNVAFGGSINVQSSMISVIILSIVLIVLAIFDIISLIRQVVFFKQFKMIKQSTLEKSVEKKVKSKGAVVFFAILIDILSFIAGIVGIFINARYMYAGGVSWILYLIDGFVSLFALLSFILLIIKLKKTKKLQQENKTIQEVGVEVKEKSFKVKDEFSFAKFDIDDLEYKLLKLKNLKNSKIISSEEYDLIRDRLFDIKTKNETNITEDKIKKN